MAKEVHLIGRKYEVTIIIDDEDYDKLVDYDWHIKFDNNNKYVHGKVNGKKIAFHRYIMNVTDPKLVVDHINHNGLDNRKENLRICTFGENSKNCRKTNNKRTSKYKGVSWDSYSNKWIVSVSKNYRNLHLGSFDDEELAAENYDYWAMKVYGEYAHVNFPAKDYTCYKPNKDITEVENRKFDSKFKGVTKSKKGIGFRSEIRLGKKLYYIGSYPTEKEAASHYDYVSWIFYKSKTKLNFPENDYDCFIPFKLNNKTKELLKELYINNNNFIDNYPIYIIA